MNIEEFEANIGYSFKDKSLILRALTHTSYANEHRTGSYERLEFLGDAIVDFLVGEYLFKHYPNMREGDMSRIRALLVCEKTFAEMALRIGIDKQMLLGHGSETSGDRMRFSILADMFEAHIAAIYLDAGIEKTRSYLLEIYDGMIDATVKGGDLIDYKTMLQEKLQQNGSHHIEYVTESEDGPIHNCIFTIAVMCDGKILGRGSGSSKKEAQQLAAKSALETIV